MAVTELVLVSLATLGLLGLGVYLIAKVRGSHRQADAPTSELLADFRKLHSKGELSDKEFRTIKSMLAERLQRELTSKGRED